MIVEFLKAGSGDCILIRHKEYNILVDGGNDPSYLLLRIDKIYELGQKIDLLIITHHDDDHISGILKLLALVDEGNYGEHFIKKVIFNSPRLISGKLSLQTDNSLSYKQASETEKLLSKIQPKWEKITEKSQKISFEELSITFLSPAEDDLEKYSVSKGAFLSSDFRCDWKSPMSLLERFIDDASLDTSLPNKTSVVIQLDCEGKKVLLTGDTTPARFEVILDNLIKDDPSGTVTFDYVKLPHHGSYRSLTKSVLSKINCQNFIICTNSKKHFLPNKRAILKVLMFLKRNENPIEILFNYKEAIDSLEITEQEKKRFKFKLIPNNHSYGLSI